MKKKLFSSERISEEKSINKEKESLAASVMKPSETPPRAVSSVNPLTKRPVPKKRPKFKYLEKAEEKAALSAFLPTAVSFNHSVIPDSTPSTNRNENPDASDPSASSPVAPADPSDSDKLSEEASPAFFMRQIDHLRETIEELQKRFSDLESEEDYFEEEHGNISEESQTADSHNLQAPSPDRPKADDLLKETVLPVENESKQDSQVSGSHVCPHCMVESGNSIRMKPRKVYIVAVSECPDCHRQSVTSRTEREAITIQPPEASLE